MDHNRITTTVNYYANVVNMCAHYNSLLTTANDNALPFLIITYYHCIVYAAYTSHAYCIHCMVLAVSQIHYLWLTTIRIIIRHEVDYLSD